MYVGVSNFAAWQICEALWKADANRWSRPVVTQVPYNLLTRAIDQELVPFAKAMDVGITVYNPLAGGLLTGKHNREAGPQDDTRFGLNAQYYRRYWMDSNLDAVDRLSEIAREAGLSLIQLAFGWLLAQECVDSVILGVSKIEHLEQNLSSAEAVLDEATLGACDEAWGKLRGDYFRYNR
jgi:aryl-alcohol dehydrogenase-like predicted oxidoreductase